MAILNLTKGLSSPNATPLWSALERLSANLQKMLKPKREMYHRLILHIDHHEDCMPQASTTLWSTVLFVIFLVFGGFAIGYPNTWMRVAVAVVNSCIFIALLILNSRDAILHSKLNKTAKILEADFNESNRTSEIPS